MKTVQEAMKNSPFPTPKLTGDQCGECGSPVQLDLKTNEPVCFRCLIAAEDKKLANEAVEAHKRMKRRKVRYIFDQQSLVNENLKKATFDNYSPPSDELQFAKNRVMDFVMTFDSKSYKNLLLVGTYGTGKSHLSYAATKHLIDEGRSCLFLSVPKLLTKIKDTYNPNSKHSEDELLEYIQFVDLLVLDDLGAEYTNKRNDTDNWAQTKIFEVVDSRAGKHTIYTTNLNSNDLEQKVNERNFSRILDNTEIIKMNGKDYRRKAF
ncbi:ATP-binding protein [Mycobacteroides abscessus]|uniref:ATP-binding protein n=1 Tax=Mycobacteroides abscessus TaxID=36809 RepID=UPI0018E45E1D